MVSGAGKPLAPALALLGRWSVWPVLLPPWGATAFTRRLPCVGGQPRLVTTWRLSSRIRVRRGRAGVHSLSVVESLPWGGESCKVRRISFNLHHTISNYAATQDNV